VLANDEVDGSKPFTRSIESPSRDSEIPARSRAARVIETAGLSRPGPNKDSAATGLLTK